MIDSGFQEHAYGGFEYSFVKKIPGPDEANKANFIHRYKFRYKNERGTNRCIFVDVEEYDFQTFIIKFYLKQDKDFKGRFNVLTEDKVGNKVLATCAKIMLKDFALGNPTYSFGFIGVSSPNEKKRKDGTTKRFRVYEQIVLSMFHPDHYEHQVIPEKGAYIILSKDNKEAGLLQKVAKMFDRHYVDLFDGT